MDYLVDSSVLIRFVAPDDPAHDTILDTILQLRTEGHQLFYTPQAIRETWSVMTRPRSANGYGLSIQDAEQMVNAINVAFLFVNDTEQTYPTWLGLVRRYGVSGKQVHDANHVAAMIAHGIRTVLTLDQRDFNRYTEVDVLVPGKP